MFAQLCFSCMSPLLLELCVTSSQIPCMWTRFGLRKLLVFHWDLRGCFTAALLWGWTAGLLTCGTSFSLCCLLDDTQPDFGFWTQRRSKMKSKPQRDAFCCVRGISFIIQSSSRPRLSRDKGRKMCRKDMNNGEGSSEEELEDCFEA